MIKANEKFFAYGFDGPGGPLLVWPHDKMGKFSRTDVHLGHGHSDAIMDTDFSPFNPNLLVSGSRDGTVKIWQVPDEGTSKENIKPISTLEGHGKRVLFTTFHPTAENVLATAGSTPSNEVFVWDITKGEATYTFDDELHEKQIQDLKWNDDGSLLATSDKSSTVRMFDPRSMDSGCAIKFKPHQGNRPCKIAFVPKFDRFITTGFDKSSKREIKYWDPRKLDDKPVQKIRLDQSPSVLYPFFDPGTNILYVCGKGESSARLYEIIDGSDTITHLSNVRGKESSKGWCCLPKRSCDVLKCEVMRFHKLTRDGVEGMHFRIPRKAKSFQEDLFPDAIFPTDPMTADAYFGGANKKPSLGSLNPKYRLDAVASTGFVAARPMSDVLADLSAAHKKIAELEAVKLGLLGELKAKGIAPLDVSPPPAPKPKAAPKAAPKAVPKAAPAPKKAASPPKVKVAKKPEPVKEMPLDAVPTKIEVKETAKKTPTNHHHREKKKASPKAKAKNKATSPKPKKKSKGDLIREVTKMCKDLDMGDVKKIHDFVTEVWEDDGN